MVTKDKLVYLVKGSEDGPLGIFTNKKLAYEKAVWYLLLGEECQESDIHFYGDDREFTKKAFNEDLDKGGSWLELGSSNVEIDAFRLNY